jgi:hypothetical protein
MTGTCPHWPRPSPGSPTHSTGGPDGDSEHADERTDHAHIEQIRSYFLGRPPFRRRNPQRAHSEAPPTRQ